MTELEKAAVEAFKRLGSTSYLEIFKAGAEWQYEQFEKNRLTACDNMTEEAAEREQRFAVNFIAENNRIPTFSDAIEYGRKTMREKAISRLENLCKEWHLHESTEAKYRMEAYKELLEMLKEEKK